MNRVVLVGAGCGADSVTVRGARLLQKCDCVVYDSLLDESVFGFLRGDCVRIFVGKRAGAKWFTVVIGAEDPSLEYGYQFSNAVEHLKYAADFLEKNDGPIMVLESLNIKNHPGLWLKKIPQAYAVCKAVGSPKCKILNDLYHQQVTEGNLIENIDAAWDEIAFFQIADNPGRNEPGTGEINYKKIMEHIYKKGYEGIIGLELVQSKATPEGDEFFVDSVRSIDVA